MSDLEKQISRTREHLIAEIHAAFKGVGRGNGVSWLEADVIDGYGDQRERAEARRKDPARPWTELVGDPNWVIHAGYGGWSFLDAEGFRYYLPAGMLRETEKPEDGNSLDFHLTLRAPRGAKERDLRPHTLEKWSLLDKRQRRCVKRFLEFMDLCARHAHEAHIRENPPNRAYAYTSPWRKALDSYWTSIPDA